MTQTNSPSRPSSDGVAASSRYGGGKHCFPKPHLRPPRSWEGENALTDPLPINGEALTDPLPIYGEGGGGEVLHDAQVINHQLICTHHA